MRLKGNLKQKENTWFVEHNGHDVVIHGNHNLWLIAHGKTGREVDFEVHEGVAVLKAKLDYNQKIVTQD